MENLDKKAKILAKIISVPGGGADDCALMRLARANGAGVTRAQFHYAILAEQIEGLTPEEAWSIACGWDGEAKDGGVLWQFAQPAWTLPEWVALGRAAARACGVSRYQIEQKGRLERARVATVDLGPKVPVPA